MICAVLYYNINTTSCNYIITIFITDCKLLSHNRINTKSAVNIKVQSRKSSGGPERKRVLTSSLCVKQLSPKLQNF